MKRPPSAFQRWGSFVLLTRSPFRPVELVDPVVAHREQVREATHDALLDLDFQPTRAATRARS